jgi:hypothetical protein
MTPLETDFLFVRGCESWMLAIFCATGLLFDVIVLGIGEKRSGYETTASRVSKAESQHYGYAYAGARLRKSGRELRVEVND